MKMQKRQKTTTLEKRDESITHPAQVYFKLLEERVASVKKAFTDPLPKIELEIEESVTKPARSDRKPHPGEEEHRAPKIDYRQTTYIPTDGFVIHYADCFALKQYKTLLRKLKIQGIPFMGHVSYDTRQQRILTLTARGAELLEEHVPKTDAETPDE